MESKKEKKTEDVTRGRKDQSERLSLINRYVHIEGREREREKEREAALTTGDFLGCWWGRGLKLREKARSPLGGRAAGPTVASRLPLFLSGG